MPLPLPHRVLLPLSPLLIVFGLSACDDVAPVAPPPPGPAEAEPPEFDEPLPADLNESLGEMLNKMGAGAAPSTPVTPLAGATLAASLPTLPGWTAGPVDIEEQEIPYPTSQARREWRRGGAVLRLTVTDTAKNPALTMSFGVLADPTREGSWGAGYERPFTVGSHRGWERWDADKRRGAAGLVVAERFLLSAEGEGLDEAGLPKQLVSTVDLRKLGGVDLPPAPAPTTP